MVSNVKFAKDLKIYLRLVMVDTYTNSGLVIYHFYINAINWIHFHTEVSHLGKLLRAQYKRKKAKCQGSASAGIDPR